MRRITCGIFGETVGGTPCKKSCMFSKRSAARRSKSRRRRWGVAKITSSFLAGLRLRPKSGAMKAAQPSSERDMPASYPKNYKPSQEPAKANKPNFMPLNLHYPGLKKVNEVPPVYIVEGFLTDDECEEFTKVAGPLLQRSKTHAIAGEHRAVKQLCRQTSPILWACALSASQPPALCACPATLQGARRRKGARP